MKMSFLAEDNHAKTRKASKNTDLDMQEVLQIDKVLPSMQGELVNNTSKLTEIDKCIKKNSKSLKEFDPTKKMILLILKNKSSSKHNQKTKTIIKRRLRGSNRPLKTSLMKINLWQNKFVLYPMGSVF